MADYFEFTNTIRKCESKLQRKYIMGFGKAFLIFLHYAFFLSQALLFKVSKAPLLIAFFFLLQTICSELKERENFVISTLDQARMFLADQPIEGPGEPRKNVQPKTG